MKPKENIEELVRAGKPHVKTGPQMDKHILDDSFAAMEQTIRNRSGRHKSNAARIITLSRMIKPVAAAAVLVVSIGLLISRLGPGEQPQTPESPADMVTAMSLRMAYREGGMEALERQCDHAVKVLGTSSRSMSLGDLLRNLNG